MFFLVDFINITDPKNINWLPHRNMSAEAMERYNEIATIANSNEPHDLHTFNVPRESHSENMNALILNRENLEDNVTIEQVREAMGRVFAMESRPPVAQRKNFVFLLLEPRYYRYLRGEVLVCILEFARV